MLHKTKKLAAALLILSIIFCTACGNTQQQTDIHQTAVTPAVTETETAAESEGAVSLGRRVKIDGTTWRYNSNLKTVLFLGIDAREQAVHDKAVGSGGRSDTIILFIIDSETKSVRMMPVSRDTITKVDIYDTKRNFLLSSNMQVTMQYAYGDSPSRSCWLSKKAITAMLHDLPISYHCSLTLDGVTKAIELMGGITLTLEDDWTDINPEYVAGAKVTMNGAEVESFLRYRDTGTAGSNNARMQRQSWFISKLFEQMGKVGQIGTETMLNYLQPYLETDMDGDTIKQLTTYKLSNDVIAIPGQNAEGERHDEFYIDDAALIELLLQVFYQRVD